MPRRPNWKELIRDVPDFPKPGIVFKDVTPLLRDPRGLCSVTDALAGKYRDARLTGIAGIESRGFIFGSPLARELGTGFIPLRKPGKLPYHTRRASYSLEYGEAALEIHEDAVSKGDRILIVDDLLATGGTAAAACSLVEGLGGEVAGCAFVVELSFLHGRDRLPGREVFALVAY